MFGDPHITTLDGARYTFNGWGEYTMVSIATEDVTFVLQSRTSLAETENGTLTNATIFTAFGAEHNETRVFVQLEPNSKDSEWHRRFQVVLCLVHNHNEEEEERKK